MLLKIRKLATQKRDSLPALQVPELAKSWLYATSLCGLILVVLSILACFEGREDASLGVGISGLILVGLAA